MSPRSQIFLIVKTSKFCNLRCTYCYEYEELGDKRRMALADLRSLITHAASAATAAGATAVRFIWHGGEPLLIPPDYYESIGELQRELLPASVQAINSVQTNLTVLTERHLALLGANGFFSSGGVGVSFDVYGDQRVDTRGRLRTEAVLANMQRLKDAGIRFGAITVLARNTRPYMRQIFQFYESLGVGFRVLPFYKSASDSQVDAHALTRAEISDAFIVLFDAWWVSERARPVLPLDEYLRHAVAAASGAPKVYFDPEQHEKSFVIDTDGSTYGLADTYQPGFAYGNIFRQDLREMCNTPARVRAVAEARGRVEKHCTGCRFHGHCPGRFVAEATPEQRRVLETEGCPVRDILAHMVRRLDEAGAVAAGSAMRATIASEQPAL